MAETHRSASENPSEPLPQSHTELHSAEQFEAWRNSLLAVPAPTPAITEVGKVTEVGDGVAVVTGLARALADELLVFESGVRGMVLDLEPGRLGVILLGPSESISLGEDVRRTRKVVSVPVRSEEHTSELQSRPHLVCRLLLEKKKTKKQTMSPTIASIC